MSENDKTADINEVTNALSSLSEDELKNLIARLKRTSLVQPRHTDERKYYLVTADQFSCVIDPRDASNEQEASLVACKRHQDWYLNKVSFREPLTTRVLTHNEYCDWLRRTE